MGFINKTILGRWETENVYMREMYYSVKFGNQNNVYNTEERDNIETFFLERNKSYFSLHMYF